MSFNVSRSYTFPEIGRKQGVRYYAIVYSVGYTGTPASFGRRTELAEVSGAGMEVVPDLRKLSGTGIKFVSDLNGVFGTVLRPYRTLRQGSVGYLPSK